MEEELESLGYYDQQDNNNRDGDDNANNMKNDPFCQLPDRLDLLHTILKQTAKISTIAVDGPQETQLVYFPLNPRCPILPASDCVTDIDYSTGPIELWSIHNVSHHVGSADLGTASALWPSSFILSNLIWYTTIRSSQQPQSPPQQQPTAIINTKGNGTWFSIYNSIMGLHHANETLPRKSIFTNLPPPPIIPDHPVLLQQQSPSSSPGPVTDQLTILEVGCGSAALPTVVTAQLGLDFHFRHRDGPSEPRSICITYTDRSEEILCRAFTSITSALHLSTNQQQQQPQQQHQQQRHGKNDMGLDLTKFNIALVPTPPDLTTKTDSTTFQLPQTIEIQSTVQTKVCESTTPQQQQEEEQPQPPPPPQIIIRPAVLDWLHYINRNLLDSYILPFFGGLGESKSDVDDGSDNADGCCGLMTQIASSSPSLLANSSILCDQPQSHTNTPTDLDFDAQDIDRVYPFGNLIKDFSPGLFDRLHKHFEAHPASSKRRNYSLTGLFRESYLDLIQHLDEFNLSKKKSVHDDDGGIPSSSITQYDIVYCSDIVWDCWHALAVPLVCQQVVKPDGRIHVLIGNFVRCAGGVQIIQLFVTMMTLLGFVCVEMIEPSVGSYHPTLDEKFDPSINLSSTPVVTSPEFSMVFIHHSGDKGGD